MRSFHEISLRKEELYNRRKPNFENFLKVLRREKPDRYTLFEFFLNDELDREILGLDKLPADYVGHEVCRAQAAAAMGYDYLTVHASGFHFDNGRNQTGTASVSMNDGAVITDRESYRRYRWNDPTDYSFAPLLEVASQLPDGMKCLVFTCDGLLENVIALTGYETLCYMLADDPELVLEIMEQVGSRLLQYYEQIVGLDCVGGLIANDDWGFKTQTMLSTNDMRRYVFPWHKRFVQTAHRAGKPILLHSCGQLKTVMDDVIDDMGFDGKHSYEDAIQPVEEAYRQYHDRIAVIGGVDVDFLCRSTPEEVYNRCCALLEQTGGVGYALGSGNSIPYYVPHENYYAMAAAALYNDI